MKTVSNGYKENIRKQGRQIDAKITYGNTIVTSSQINQIVPNFNTNILKTAMKSVEIDSNVEILPQTEINVQFGVLVNNFEYIDYGNYIVNSCEYNADTLSYKIKAYDKMLFFMVNAEDTFIRNLTYPISVKNYLDAICSKIGITLSTDTFINDETLINQDVHSGINYTYRDILDEIAQITGSIICINSDDELEVRYPIETNEVIDEHWLKETNVTLNKKYKINALVFSRSADSDTINRRDETLIQEDGLQEYKIKDNQILSTNDRDTFIDELWDYLDGFEYYTCDYDSTGITFLEIADRYTISINNILYSTIMLNDETNIGQGLGERIYSEMPKQTETNYKTSSQNDKMFIQANLNVDKQIGQIQGTVANINGEIDTLKSNDENIQGTLNQVTLDLDGFRVELQNNTEQLNNAKYDFNTEGLTVTKDGAKVKSTLNNEGVSVYDTGDNLQAIFNNNGSGVDKLIVTGTAQLGYLKFTKGYKNGKKVTQIFHLENLIEDLEDLKNEVSE